MEKATKLAIICGSGLEDLFIETEQVHVGTPYGIVLLSMGKIGDRSVVFLPRHGRQHSIPPHKINYRANIWGLREVGVERIIALNAVGAINREFEPCDVVVPHDFIDFTKSRESTFYDEAPVTHVDISQPFCPTLRKLIIGGFQRSDLKVWEKSVLLTTEGPRYETPAEVEMFRRLGGDVIGMTGCPEVVLARELGICYVSVCYVSNRAAGLQGRLSTAEVKEVSKAMAPRLRQPLIESIKALPWTRNKCLCSNALENARFP